MEKRFLKHSEKPILKKIKITGSKSESNRLLILKKIFPQIQIENCSNAHDTQVLEKALSLKKSTINIGHAGTAMRFLTAFLAAQKGTFLLTGSERMQQRPIKILVDALRNLGANIEYEKKEGFPPLKITGKKLNGGKISINGNVSSQYITALLLIAPSLEKGLEIYLEEKITSVPYIKMTLSLLKKIGVKCAFEKNIIFVKPFSKIKKTKIIVESDWSSASYYYSLAALSAKGKIALSIYKKNSLQGDSILKYIYEKLGVQTIFKNNTLQLFKKENFVLPKHLELDFIQCPDIAQTIAVTCFGLGIACDLKGLHTLKIKETDRLVALKTELEKLGGNLKITNESLHLETRKNPIRKNIAIATYEDHRMAMAFAPLYLKTDISIENPKVVVKSYPDFWEDFL